MEYLIVKLIPAWFGPKHNNKRTKTGLDRYDRRTMRMARRSLRVVWLEPQCIEEAAKLLCAGRIGRCQCGPVINQLGPGVVRFPSY